MVSGLTQVSGITAVATTSGGTGVAISGTVANFAALPAASGHTNELYRVSAAQGSWILGTRKPAGVYESDGTNWTYIAYFIDVASEISNDSTVAGDTVASALSTLNTDPYTVRSFGVTYDGGGSAPTANSSASRVIPYNCRIVGWSLSSNVSGQAQIDLLVGGASLVGSGNYPTLAGNKVVTASAQSWTTTIVSAGQAVYFSLVSATTTTNFSATIKTVLV